MGSANTDWDRRLYDLQLQQIHKAGKDQFTFGGRFVSGRNHSDSHSITFLPIFDVVILDSLKQSTSKTMIYEGWFRGEIRWSASFNTTLALRYQNARIGAEFSDTTYAMKKLNPLIGISYRVSNSLNLRTAAFRTMNTAFLGSKISPSTVAGFPIDRNEFTTTIRNEFDFSVEYKRNRTFILNHFFFRNFEVPSQRLPSSGNTKLNNFHSDFRQLGFNIALNHVLTSNLSLFSDNELLYEKTSAFERDDYQFKIGLNYIHKNGFFARISNTNVIQRFSNIDLAELNDSIYSLTDLELKYEFPQKRGILELRATNLFDQKFGPFIESLSTLRVRPKRSIMVLFEWRF